MKRHLIIGAGIIATMMFMASCSNETEEIANLTRSENTQKEELENLRLCIARLNEQWEGKPKSLSTRIANSGQSALAAATAKKARSIVGADLAGASAGAKFGPWWALGIAAAASAIAYIEITATNSTATVTPITMRNATKQLVYVQDGETPTMIDSLGYYHNLVLRKIGTSKLTTANLNNIEALVEQGMEDIFGEKAKSMTAAGLKSNDGYKFMKSHIAKLNNAQDVTTYCNILSGCESISQDELGVIEEYMLGLESNDNANGEYTIDVLNAVNSSALDAATKDRIKAGVVVGNASQKLWIAK